MSLLNGKVLGFVLLFGEMKVCVFILFLFFVSFASLVSYYKIEYSECKINIPKQHVDGGGFIIFYRRS